MVVVMKKLFAACALLVCSSSLADVPSPKPATSSPDSTPSILRGLYVRTDFGGSIPANKLDYQPYNGEKFKSSPIYSIGIGYNISDFFRTDLNIQYRKFNYNSTTVDGSGTTTIRQHTENFALFWNGYLDAKNSSIFTPYITGGIGYSELFAGSASNHHTTISGMPSADSFPGKSSNNFAWNGGVGTRMKVIESIDLDLAYRYVGLGKLQFDQSSGNITPGSAAKLRTHEVTLGIAYNF